MKSQVFGLKRSPIRRNCENLKGAILKYVRNNNKNKLITQTAIPKINKSAPQLSNSILTISSISHGSHNPKQKPQNRHIVFKDPKKLSTPFKTLAGIFTLKTA